MSSKAFASRIPKQPRTERMQSLAAATLAQKIGYLRIETLPGSLIFDGLPTRAFRANRVIRLKDELALVKQGLVEISHLHYGKSVRTLEAGALFGELPLLGQSLFGTAAKTGAKGATIAVMDAEAARQWVKQNPLALMELVGPRLARIESDHYRARFQLADAKLASALLEMAGEGAAIVGPSHAEIGREVGLFRETVTNKLNSMKAAGLVKLGRRQITLLDKRALREMSEL